MSAFVDRWLIDLPSNAEPRRVRQAVALLAGLTALLVAAIFLNHQLQRRLPDVWMLFVIALAVGLAKVRYSAHERLAMRLWQLLGALSAFYALIHYPLMPALPEAGSRHLLMLIVLVWVFAVGCGIACFRAPSLALVPPAFLFWSSVAAARVTGLVHGHTLDVDPLPEVSMCLGLGLAILAAARSRVSPAFVTGAEPSGEVDPMSDFARIVPMLAICIHLANYFWSAVAKLTLHGPFLSWIWFNNPVYIYLAALDDRHITFSELAFLARNVGVGIDRLHVLANVIVFAAQAAAIFGLLLPRRLLILLLLTLDLMHIAIAVTAGANFWPWILLNVAIAAVVASPDFRRPKPLLGLLAMAFICLAPVVANVALLGWYDSGANNNVFLQAEDAAGRRYYVSPNFFTFYSYPMAHMVYGMPQPETAFAVGDPNGGTRSYKIAQAGRTCDTRVLIQPGTKRGVESPDFGRFIVNYHAMARGIENRFGIFPYNLYPHHFYVRPGLMAPFDALDKDKVVAYIYRRESVCLSLQDGKLRRRLISEGEYRIDVPHG